MLKRTNSIQYVSSTSDHHNNSNNMFTNPLAHSAHTDKNNQNSRRIGHIYHQNRLDQNKNLPTVPTIPTTTTINPQNNADNNKPSHQSPTSKKNNNIHLTHSNKVNSNDHNESSYRSRGQSLQEEHQQADIVINISNQNKTNFRFNNVINSSNGNSKNEKNNRNGNIGIAHSQFQSKQIILQNQRNKQQIVEKQIAHKTVISAPNTDNNQVSSNNNNSQYLSPKFLPNKNNNINNKQKKMNQSVSYNRQIVEQQGSQNNNKMKYSLSQKGQKYKERQQNQIDNTSNLALNIKNIKLPSSVVEILRSRKNVRRKQMVKSQISESIIAKFRQITNKFVCEICATQYEEKQKNKLGKCQHYFCDQCLRHYMDYKIGRYQQVTCPAQNCTEIIDIQGNFYKSLSQLHKQKYMKLHTFYSVMKKKNEDGNYQARLCPDQHCIGVIQIKQKQPLVCDKCHKVYCANCFFPLHQGKCQRNQVDFFQNNLHYRQCNSCKNVVEKIEGCNHIRCKCGYEFCYICGKRWNNNHSCQALIPSIPVCYSCFQKWHEIGGTGYLGKTLRTLIKIFLSTPIFLFFFITNFLKSLFVSIILFIITIILGCTVYAFVFACQCGCCCGLLLILLYPVSMVAGIGLAFCQFSIDIFANVWNNFFDQIRETHQGLYKWD